MNLSARSSEAPRIALEEDAENTNRSGETNGYHWTRARYSEGDEAVEELIVAELGHAWSGGSSTGTFTDEHGPDATAEIISFFRANPRTGTR
jgi:poly(3-hydroxybutyrate) depolymerase